jgi:hypothetical protein
MTRTPIGAVALLLLLPTAASAQTRWKAIGKTNSGNTVYVDPRSVHTAQGRTQATVRVVFTTPVQTPEGAWYTARTKATFDCATKKLAVKENTYYGNAKETKVVEHKVNKIPGYGAVPAGSLGAVALDYFCHK